ncbi:MAG: hypothetical protein ACOY3K_08385 [Candidatus Omnitrophota bacterium]
MSFALILFLSAGLFLSSWQKTGTGHFEFRDAASGIFLRGFQILWQAALLLLLFFALLRLKPAYVSDPELLLPTVFLGLFLIRAFGRGPVYLGFLVAGFTGGAWGLGRGLPESLGWLLGLVTGAVLSGLVFIGLADRLRLSALPAAFKGLPALFLLAAVLAAVLGGI